jgi:hypothetical protein
MDAQRCLILHQLRREMLSARTRGRVVVEFDDGVATTEPAETRAIADNLITLVNLPRLGPHWFMVDPQRAAAIITAVLHWDLETQLQRVPEQRAHELTERFLSQFGGDAVCWSNVRPGANLDQSPHRWASGAELDELDAGVAVVSPTLAGLLWVEDRPTRSR